MAAFLAISRRFRGDSFAALALPPRRPPLRPALAARVSGSFPFGESFGDAPVAISTISFPSWAKSRGRFGLATA